MASNDASLRGIVFDAVGTLIYPDPSAAVTYYEIGRRHGSKLTQREVRQRFSRALKQLPYEARTDEERERLRWRRIVADVFADLSDIESLFEQLWNHFARSTSWKVFDDVRDVLSEMSELGLVMAIGSNFDSRLYRIANELRLTECIDSIFVSSDVGFTKPSINFYRAVESELGIGPRQLMMVGDDLVNDHQGATDAGWHSLLISRENSEISSTSIRTLREIVSRLA